ncbi:MAG: DNA-directed RNA polymerase subunit beta [Clostridia bacterium]
MDKLAHIKKRLFGNTERYCFSKVDEVLDVPYLLEIQKDAYARFLKTGIKEILDEFSPIVDYSGKGKLFFLDFSLDEKPKYDVAECLRRGSSYTVALKAKTRFVVSETGNAIESEVFLGDIPLMTEDGSFVFNGVQRTVVSQIVRSPSMYVSLDGKDLSTLRGQIIPTRGNWLELEQGANEIIKVVINRGSKVSLGVFLKCFGINNTEIAEAFGNNSVVKNILDKEPQQTEDEALLELAKKMPGGEVPSAEVMRNFIVPVFFSEQWYNLARVGRYNLNKKLSIARRIIGLEAAENVLCEDEILAKKGEVFTAEVAEKIQDSGVNEVWVMVDGKKHFMRGNNRVNLSAFFPCNEKELGILEQVYLPTLKQILKENKTKEKRAEAIKAAAKELMTSTLTIDDILASVSVYLDNMAGINDIDNIDHLAHRRIASVGELMGNALRSGINKLAGAVRDALQSKDLNEVTPSTIINPRPVNKALKDFISSSQLSQLMDQINPLSGLTQKRKISAVGPGGIKKERASAEVRDVHYTHYGRICAIETPEGQSIGLISTLASFVKINDYGLLETPYRVVNKETGIISRDVVYRMADAEDTSYIAQAIEPLTEDGHFVNKRIVCRYKNTVVEVPSSTVDLVDVSPRQFISAATALIPFLGNNDTPRALMGANMQRQAVPLLKPEAPIVATGMESKIAHDCGAMILASNDGVVSYVSANQIKVLTANGEDIYDLIKFRKTNQDTCMNQKPNCKLGQAVKKGDLLADGYSTQNGELAIGKNVLVAYMNWEGYNFEDAIIISDRIVKEDVFTSITLKVEEIKCRTTKLGDEEITRDIPNLGEEALKDLDENGIVRVGAEVHAGDILVGKVTPKGETELTPEERLLRAIFGEKAREVRDTSLRVQHGRGGVVVDVQIFSRKNKDELDPGVTMMVKVIVAQRRKLSVGDKLSGRHGNKGVVSVVLPQSDMPFMANGQPIDIVLNPLGIPSRMNVGQVLEVHLGLVAKSLNWKVCVPTFDGATASEIQELLVQNNFPADGKIQLYDGRTGEPFETAATVGWKYMLKLDHMVDSKMHARSIGPYSLITQQPLGGKAMFGGQRFGEMEVWALEAYGAANILQEMLTVKSDDTVGRVKTYESIIKGLPIAEPGVPEAFKVLVKELQSLALDVKILTGQNQEFSISDLALEDTNDHSLASAVESELSSISLEKEEETKSEILEEIEKQTTVPDFDASGLFDSFDGSDIE